MNPFSDNRTERLENQNKLLISALIGIIESCAHPDKAIRCVMVDLKPIRKVLSHCGVVDVKIGIDK